MTRTHFYGASDWDKAEFNPGLGCIVKNSKHRDKIAKERGLIEIGNESLEKTIEKQDKDLKAAEERRFEKAFEETGQRLYNEYYRNT